MEWLTNAPLDEIEKRYLFKISMKANLQLNKQSLTVEEKTRAQEVCGFVAQRLIEDPMKARELIYSISSIKLFHKAFVKVLGE